MNMEEGEINRARVLIGIYNNSYVEDRKKRLIVDDPKTGDAYTFFNRYVIETFK